MLEICLLIPDELLITFPLQRVFRSECNDEDAEYPNTFHNCNP